jgi:cysteinyl-tRNA synthetase
MDVFNTFTEAVRDPAEGKVPDELLAAIMDDLNTPLAVTVLHKLVDECRKSANPWSQSALDLRASCVFLGIDLKDASYRKVYERQHGQIDEAKIKKLVDQRTMARTKKNWKESDRIRDELAAMGVVLKDAKDGTTWEIAR